MRCITSSTLNVVEVCYFCVTTATRQNGKNKFPEHFPCLPLVQTSSAAQTWLSQHCYLDWMRYVQTNSFLVQFSKNQPLKDLLIINLYLAGIR